MENNWKEKAEEILPYYINMDREEVIDAMLEAMNLVFEATKKECADRAEADSPYHGVDKESILNINKPNL